MAVGLRFGGEPDWYTPRHEFVRPDKRDAEWVEMFPYLWNACEFPERPLDTACFFAVGSDPSCPACEISWEAQGCPRPAPLPPIPDYWLANPLRCPA